MGYSKKFRVSMRGNFYDCVIRRQSWCENYVELWIVGELSSWVLEVSIDCCTQMMFIGY